MNINNFFYFLFPLCLLTAYSCKKKHSKIYDDIVEVDSLLYHCKDDSAKLVFNLIDFDNITENEDKAYYYIIETEIKYRLDEDFETDEKINYSIDYYTKKLDKEKLG